MQPDEIPLSEGDVNLSPRRREWQREALDDATRRWLAEDARAFLHQSLSTPCLDVLTACEGIYLEDLQGRRIMDFHGNSVHQVGFRNPRVVEAIKRQLDTLPFCTRRYTNLPAIQLAQKLAELAPGRLKKVLFAPGGAEAMGIAMKLARVATGRFKTVSMWDSFHGASLDTISLGGETLFRRGIGPLLPGAEHVPPPHPTHCPFGCAGECRLLCADYIGYVLEREGDVGAVIAEPIRSILATPPPAGYWARVREICDRRGALLVFDEIPICLGRTGTLFACKGLGVTPDILVIGKGLGGGIVPMAAVIAHEDLDVAPDIALGHYTHEKSPLGAAAALATLECIEEEDLLAHTQELGRYTMERLCAMQKRHPLIGEARGLGLQIAVELVRENGEPAVEEADAVMYAALRAGLSFKVTGGNVLALTPPLIITKEEMDRALDILEGCLAGLRG
ncbi:MAG TPA: aspartate aminotransferase family protein [Chthonomonadaceae bacterium]|nr:aspartate aminotransferase family protein [Chthonomonadaceae bacterium]